MSTVSFLLVVLAVLVFCIYFELREIRKILQEQFRPKGEVLSIRALLHNLVKQLETIAHTTWGANEECRNIKAILRDMMEHQDKPR